MFYIRMKSHCSDIRMTKIDGECISPLQKQTVLDTAAKQHVFPWVGTALELGDGSSSPTSPGGRIFCFLPMPTSGGSRIFERGVQVQADYGNSTDCFIMAGELCLCRGCEVGAHPREARKNFGI